jgi:molecular chaperone DnaK
VLQGERPLAKDNRTLGRFHLVGVPPAPRGVPQIEVTFDVDANGIVNVSAKDLSSGKEQKITITATSGLTKEEVDRMVKEAQSHATEDQQRRALIDARNEADAVAYAAEKMLNEYQNRVPAADRSRIASAIAELRKVMAGHDEQAIKRNTEEVQHATQALAQMAAASPQGSGQGGSQSGRPDVTEGEVIDAEPVETRNGR